MAHRPKQPKPKNSIAAIKRHRTARLARLITRAYYLHRRGRDEQLYNMICEEFVSLGGVYIKFLQGVLLRSQIMRRWDNPNKLRIFENLDSEPLDIVSILNHELGKEKLKQIASIQPQPFAAGSFGQVYYGQLANGQPIIIKVLRPMVRELLRYDLKLLSAFSRSFFTRLYKNMSLELNEALQAFRDSTLRETDYRQEAAFAHEMHQAYLDHPSLIIPETYLDLSTDNIIVQDYVDGLSVAQLIKFHEQGVDPVDYVQEILGSDLDIQLQVVGYESLFGIFRLGKIQGDPHPGNIRLLRDNKVGLIDFGIRASAPDEKGALFGMLEAYDRMFKGSQTAIGLFEQGLRFFVSDLYRALKKLASIYGSGGGKDYLKEVSNVAGEAFAELTSTDIINADFTKDQNMLMIINKLVNKGNRFGLVMKLEATDILRAIQTYSSLVSNLGRYQEVIGPVMDKVVRDVRSTYPEMVNENDDAINISDALETIMKWLERVAERDPALFRQLTQSITIRKEPPVVPVGEEIHA